jgi:leucyl aminopeptidase
MTETTHVRTWAEAMRPDGGDALVVCLSGGGYPMAFLTVASRLDVHGTSSDRPLPYAHLDGGRAFEDGDWQHGRPTAAPLLALEAWMGMTETQPA